MRLVAVVLVCALVLGQDGGRAVSLLDFALRTHAAGTAPPSALRRRTAGDTAVEDSNPCFSLRENEDHWQLLCNDRRSKFNFNPLSLRFGKRYFYRRAVKRARANRGPPSTCAHARWRCPPETGAILL